MADTDTQNDGTPEDKPQEKTAKQLKKEAEKAAKLEKLKAKLDKKSSAPAVVKEKPEVVTLYCNFDQIRILLNYPEQNTSFIVKKYILASPT